MKNICKDIHRYHVSLLDSLINFNSKKFFVFIFSRFHQIVTFVLNISHFIFDFPRLKYRTKLASFSIGSRMKAVLFSIGSRFKAVPFPIISRLVLVHFPFTFRLHLVILSYASRPPPMNQELRTTELRTTN